MLSKKQQILLYNFQNLNMRIKGCRCSEIGNIITVLLMTNCLGRIIVLLPCNTYFEHNDLAFCTHLCSRNNTRHLMCQMTSCDHCCDHCCVQDAACCKQSFLDNCCFWATIHTFQIWKVFFYNVPILGDEELRTGHFTCCVNARRKHNIDRCFDMISAEERLDRCHTWNRTWNTVSRQLFRKHANDSKTVLRYSSRFVLYFKFRL